MLTRQDYAGEAKADQGLTAPGVAAVACSTQSDLPSDSTVQAHVSKMAYLLFDDSATSHAASYKNSTMHLLPGQWGTGATVA